MNHVKFYTLFILFIFNSYLFAQSPIISVTPASLSVNLYSGKATQEILAISNIGSGNLIYDISISNPSGQESQNYTLLYDGVDDFVQLTNANLLGLTNSTFTVENWMNITLFSDIYGEAFLGNPVYGGLHFLIRDYKPHMGFWYNGVSGNTIIQTNVWYHLTWRYRADIQEQAIFVNGELDTSETGHPPYQNNETLAFGRWHFNEAALNGYIDEVRIWNYARTQSEIQTDMYRELNGTEPGLIGYWPFNEGSGTTAHDLTSSSNHGLLQGGVTWVPSTAPIAPSWLSIMPDSGNVTAGSSDNISVGFDASGLSGGQYDANIIISSNDPITPEVIIPVFLNVTDAPSISVETDTLDFGQIFLGTTDSMELAVENNGSLDLLIFSATAQPNEYNVSPPFAGLNPGEIESFTVGFSPPVLGSYPGTLTFSSNDPIQGNYVVILMGECVEPPVIGVSPESLSVALQPGQTASEILTLINSGGSNLYFDVVSGWINPSYALQFDGIDDYVNTATQSAIGLTNDMTVEAWIRLDPGETEAIIGGNGDLHTDKGFSLGLTNSKIAGVFNRGNSDWTTFKGTTNVSTESWHHFALTYSGTIAYLYLDGVLEYSNVVAKWTDHTLPLRIGKEIGAHWADPIYDPFDGLIDEVRIWNFSRTQSEIQVDMYRALNGTEPGLVGYWPFIEGSGTTAYDLTASSNHGSLQGGVTWVPSTAPIVSLWLSVSPDSGICLANSTTDITASFKATNLDTGEYHANLFIKSNDPYLPELTIPVHLEVSCTVNINGGNCPTRYSLYQNYPNPFNPSTAIEFDLPKSSQVTLKVFNILGEEVATLVSDKLSASSYSYEWNASNLASGVYLYRLQAGDYVLTRKMVLMR